MRRRATHSPSRGGSARTVLPPCFLASFFFVRLRSTLPNTACVRRAPGCSKNEKARGEWVEPRAADDHVAGMSPASRLALTNVSKRYPGVQANDRVSLTVMPGEIHAVLGENGAGKSTLMKIIYGAVRPDAGALAWNGAPVAIAQPAPGARAGHRHGVPALRAVRDADGRRERLAGLDEHADARAAVAREVERVSELYGLELEPRGWCSSLSVGERQRVEILRALLTNPQLLILDEPTAVLTPQMAERLFVTLRQLAAGGCSILYISHKLDEVRALCDALHGAARRARRSAPSIRASRPTAACRELMLGAAPPRAARARGARSASRRSRCAALSLPPVDDLGIALARHRPRRCGSGEILGVAGVSGNGQAELLAALSGEDRRAPRARIRLSAATSRARRRARAARSASTSSPRSASAAARCPGCRSRPTRCSRGASRWAQAGWLHRGRARRLAARLIERFGVSARGPDAVAGSLSGGNLQKFIVGREVDAAPKVLVVAQPTWGLDVGAAAQIRREIAALCDAGAAVLSSARISRSCSSSAPTSWSSRAADSHRGSPSATPTPALIGQWMSGLFARDGVAEPAPVATRVEAPCLGLVPRSPPSRALRWPHRSSRWRLTVLFGAVCSWRSVSRPGRRSRCSSSSRSAAPTPGASWRSRRRRWRWWRWGWRSAFAPTSGTSAPRGSSSSGRSGRRRWRCGAHEGTHAAIILPDDRARRDRRGRGLGRGGRVPARSLERQRDPGEPDAGLRGRHAPRLPDLRPLEGSRRLQLSADDQLPARHAGPAARRGAPRARRSLRGAARGAAGPGCFCFGPTAASSWRSVVRRRAPRATPVSRRAARSGRRCSARAASPGWRERWR